jgi:hypothetical protein
VTVTEGNTGAVNATFTASLSVAYDVAVTVHDQTANGSATAGSDYAAASGDVIIAAGQTITVTLSAAYDQAVTMSYRTMDGTATTSDNDYVAQTGTLTFNPGETTKTITITVNGDSKKEADETFYLDLFGNNSNSLFTKSRGLGTILNDD